jgi:hypothetical protein
VLLARVYWPDGLSWWQEGTRFAAAMELEPAGRYAAAMIRFVDSTVAWAMIQAPFSRPAFHRCGPGLCR